MLRRVEKDWRTASIKKLTLKRILTGKERISLSLKNLEKDFHYPATKYIY